MTDRELLELKRTGTMECDGCEYNHGGLACMRPESQQHCISADGEQFIFVRAAAAIGAKGE